MAWRALRSAGGWALPANTVDVMQERRKVMKVTMTHLVEIGACQPAREWFNATYGADATVPLAQVLRAVVEVEDGLCWVDWYFDIVRLPAPVEVAYQDAISAANDAYQSAIKAADYAYWKATAAANGVYKVIVASTNAAYRGIIATAEGTHQNVGAAAEAAHHTVTSAEAAYQVSWKAARAAHQVATVAAKAAYRESRKLAVLAAADACEA